MQKLIIIEPSKSGAEHLTFNSLVVSALLLRAPESTCLAAAKSHYEALGHPSIAFCQLPIVSIVKRRFIAKVLVEAFAIAKAFLYAKNHGIQHAIVLSVFPPLLFWLTLMARLLGISTTLILHGELEGLVDSSRQRITSFGYWVQWFFKGEGYRHIKCIVLSEGIHRRLMRLYPAAAEFVSWANHPLAKPNSSSKAQRDFSFATVGVSTEKKHGQLFRQLADFAESGQHVAHVGMTEPELFDRYRQKIKFFCSPGKHLSQDEFEIALKRVSHAVFPYAQSSYQMTVSGAMLDAIACGCKVVCLPNDFAKDLVDAGLPVTIAANLESLLRPIEEQTAGNIPWHSFSADAFCDKLLDSFSVGARVAE